MTGKHGKTRLILTLTDQKDELGEKLYQELEKTGFTVLQRLDDINILLGEYAGDQTDLLKVQGVASVEVEGSKETQ